MYMDICIYTALYIEAVEALDLPECRFPVASNSFCKCSLVTGHFCRSSDPGGAGMAPISSLQLRSFEPFNAYERRRHGSCGHQATCCASLWCVTCAAMSGSPALASKDMAPEMELCGAARMSHRETWPSCCGDVPYNMSL